MMKKRILGFLLTIGLLVSSVCTGYATELEPTTETGLEESGLNLENVQEIETNVTQLSSAELTTDVTLSEMSISEPNVIAEDEIVPVIIVFEDNSIVEDNANAVMNLITEWKTALLENKQESVIEEIEQEVLDGNKLEIAYQYTWLLNGIATEVPYGMMAEIEAIDGVEKVVLQTTYETCETTGTESTEILEQIRSSGLDEYDGKGMKIAIIDTGIDEDHPSFAALEESQLSEYSATLADVSSVFEQLNAYQKHEFFWGETLTPGEVYRNSKIPYGFNYVYAESNVGHYDGNDHGTHVAGIAAANDFEGAEMCGVAPAAQLYVMKVFSGSLAYTEDIIAAVEDSMILGADVINMSLGETAGFSSGGEYLDQIYGRVSETGTILVVAAGNEGTSGNGNNWHYGLSLAENPDNGTVGSPGTYVNALTVANADSTGEEVTLSWSSSRGPSPDLSLEPDIAAPGTAIYSAINNGTYGSKSGTSMAAPYVAGAAALMQQMLREGNVNVSAADQFTFINSVLMSTAEPISYEDMYWSPRSQGAGMVSLEKAMKSQIVLSVAGMDVPKVELKDDPEKTGLYQYEFSVLNYGDEAAYFEVDTCVQTEQVTEREGLQFMSGNPAALEAVVQTESEGLVKTLDYTEDGAICTADARKLYIMLQKDEVRDSEEEFRYDVDENNEVNSEDVQCYLDALTGKAEVNLEAEVLKVEAGSSESASISIEVTENGKAYMDQNFENGIYVEGYTFLKAQNANAVDLSLPYMGFYGDWTKAPIFDEGYYWEDPEESGANFSLNEINTQKKDYTDWQLGMNPYLAETFDAEHISISPNGDGNADFISQIKLSLLRNVDVLTVTFEGEDGQCYDQFSDEKVRKASFGKSYNTYMYYGATDESGQLLENNTKITMKIELALEYEQENFDVWEVPITIDTEAPQVLQTEGESDITVLSDGNRQYIRMKFSDNIGVAAICLLDENAVTYTKYLSDHEKEANGEYQYFDITGVGDNFYVVLGDYAFNQSLYQIETTGNEYEINSNTLYGYRIADETCESHECFGWMDISQKNATAKSVSTDQAQNLSAAEYVDGHVIAIDMNGNLVAFEFDKWDERKQITWIEDEITDLAYDPETQHIYAYSASGYSVLKIDPVTGEYIKISPGFITSIVAMTCSDSGVLYAITREGALHTVDKATGKLSEEPLLNTGLLPSKQQSMTYDKEQNCIYWACYEYQWSYETQKGRLVKIDLDKDYEMTILGTIGGNAQVVGLMMLNDRGYGLFENVELDSLVFEQSHYMILTGQSQLINAVFIPWCGNSDDLLWTTSNADIVEVTPEGWITGKAAGEANIQIQKSGTVIGECHITVLDVNAELYGVATFGSETLSTNWIKMNAQNRQLEVLEAIDQSFLAAEYVNGIVYASDENGDLYKISAEGKELISNMDGYYIMDMAYDYQTETMYAIAQEGYTFVLIQIDLNSGERTIINYNCFDSQDYSPFYGITVSKDGIIYMISASGNICKYDVDTRLLTPCEYMGNMMPTDLWSATMTYDHDNGGIYIVPYSYSTGVSLWYYEPEYGMIISLGAINDLTQLKGVFIVQ